MHFGNEPYVLFTAVDKNSDPAGVLTAEIVPLSGLSVLVGDPDLGRWCMGVFYQIAVNKEVSLDYKDLSVATQLYSILSQKLPEITTYGPDGWLCSVTESRAEGRELEAIMDAGFGCLVPNKYYMPPATRVGEIREKQNRITKDLVLLWDQTEEGDPSYSEKLLRWGPIAAGVYLASAYTLPEHKLTLSEFTCPTIRGYFEGAQLLY
ncbi:hypothetical protein KY347_06995 [Candidatus Woesearchaeota archaeon]|nr:hypothetical protein [Candidatus Woesearchaeota archaeon]